MNQTVAARTVFPSKPCARFHAAIGAESQPCSNAVNEAGSEKSNADPEQISDR